MSNTLTGLIPILYSSAAKVAREAVGFVKAVDTRFDSRGAGQDQTVRVPIAPVQAVGDYAPGAYAPSGTDRTGAYADVTINKNRYSSFHLTGEQDAALMSGGNDIAGTMFAQSVQQAMRAVVNEIETGIGALEVEASAAYGTAGTAPFASDLTALAQVRKMLIDRGTGMDDLQLVIDTAAGANLRSKTVLGKANELGTDSALRSGALVNLMGVNIHESAGVNTHTAGTGSGYKVNNVSGYAVGSTTIAADTGTGTILAGDVIENVTSSVDSTKYTVKTALSAGSLVLQKPGLVKAWANDNDLTVSATHAANLAFHRNAIILVTRPPIIEANALLQTTLATDEVSGLTFMIVRALQDGQTTYRVHLAYGFKVLYPEYIVKLLG